MTPRLPKYFVLCIGIVLGTLLFCLAAPPQGVHAQSLSGEVISFYHSNITVNSDGSLSVKEEIEARSTGDKIKHGIYRDFPTRYPLGLGFEKDVGYKIISVTKNGKEEPYSISPQKNGLRIYIGNPSILLSPGLYRYEILYKTDRQLGFFPRYDELYYNITGNGWEFPIEHAIATIILPGVIDGSKIMAIGYTGGQGSKEQAVTMSKDAVDGKNVVYIESIKSLGKYEGLTIAVSWPKGYSTPPSVVSSTRYFLTDNLLQIIGIVLTLGLLAYYGTIWFIHGRDPKGRKIITLFSPPKDISPALCRYINLMAYDQKHITVALVSMAVKRYLKIHKKIATFSVERVSEDNTPLSDDEKEIAGQLFENGESLFSFSSGKYGQVKKIIRSHKNYFEEKLKNLYVLPNSRYIKPGIVSGALYLVLFGAVYGRKGEVFFLLVWLLIWNVFVSILIIFVYSYWKSHRMRETIVMGLISAPFVVGEIAALVQLAEVTSMIVVFLIIIQVVLLIAFYLAFRVRTQAGREIEDQTEGFKTYLLAVEKRRYEIDNMPVPEKISMYERYLPYAIALDIEPEWTKQFDETLKALSPEEKEEYLSWYVGYNFSSSSGSSLGSSFGNALTGAISSSSTAPGSSSGGGGGGSSGGGGGGGGGGGW